MSQASAIEKAESFPAQDGEGPDTAPVSLARILVALDASDHADRALAEAARLCASAGGVVTGIHAYAAKLHDKRFRQMEGGLPERYREEQELEHQRAVHDSLITRGLGVISESYHDAAAAVCAKAAVPYRRLSPEGKNYRCIAEAAASGAFDVLAMGALGIGTVPGSVIGTVCERVARRSPIDMLVIRDPARALGDGPLVVGIDGSQRSFGVLKTALDIARRLGAEVHAVAAYDPYFHYVAFNRIAGVLSEEAGKVVRFREQERLHEELIDDGLARIYQSHLAVARSIAEAEGRALVCELLAGKPYRAITAYVAKVEASLLLIGKTGIHADSELDIGGNAENLLRLARCHLWLGTASYRPPLDAVARETISWTAAAERRLAHVPESAREMVRMAVARHAQKTGHTVITDSLMEEATRLFCPARAAPSGESRGGGCPFNRAKGTEDGVVEPRSAGSSSLEWTPEALKLLDRVPQGVMRHLTRQRIEAFARRHRAAAITPKLMQEKYAQWAAGSAKHELALEWDGPARQRIDRVPAFVRGMVILEVERCARRTGAEIVTDKVIDRALKLWAESESFHSGKRSFGDEGR